MSRHSIDTTDDLLAGLELATPDGVTFVGPGLVMPKASWVFGGLVGAQSLMAAATTAPGKVPRSVRIRFLRQARAHAPIHHLVTPVADSNTFADRRVEVTVDDELVATATIVFHAPDQTDLAHQHRAPTVPEPDESAVLTGAGFEVIDLNDPPAHSTRVGTTVQRHWMRGPGTPRDDVLVNAAMLTMASDLFLVASAWRPIDGHAITQVDRVMTFGLDFTVWFHDAVAMADWHLLDVDTPSAANGRSLSLANWFDRAGALVASVALDSVMRVRAVSRDGS